jgi:flagellar biosynthesis protein FliP
MDFHVDGMNSVPAPMMKQVVSVSVTPTTTSKTKEQQRHSQHQQQMRHFLDYIQQVDTHDVQPLRNLVRDGYEAGDEFGGKTQTQTSTTKSNTKMPAQLHPSYQYKS